MMEMNRILADIKPKIVNQFMEFHGKNPEVYIEFKAIARETHSNHRRYGAKAICEFIRYDRGRRPTLDDFKINNNFPSCYARLLIAEDPTFKDFFEVRHSPGVLPVKFDELGQGAFA